MDFLEKLGSTIAIKGKEASDKAKELTEIARLKSQIATCEEVVKKNYMEIGKLYYEQNKDNPEADFAKQCRNVTNAQNGIREINKQIEAVKGL